MTLDVLSQVLSKADNPTAAGEYLVQELRELTGARCVVLTEKGQNGTHQVPQLINVNPARRKVWAESEQARGLYQMVHGLEAVTVFKALDTSPTALWLQDQGLELSIAVPLQVGTQRVGTMLTLGLPEATHLNSALNLLQTISPLIALVLRHALFCQRQEDVIQERTSELQATNMRLHDELAERRQAEERIRTLNAELEGRVKERTAQLETANDELQRTNRELEAFSYSVSHDLRAPLRGIEGWSLALQEDFGSGLQQRARTYLNHVRSEAKRMSDLIENMLKLSQITQAEIKLELLDLSVLVDTICSRLTLQHAGRNLDFFIQPGLCAYADRSLIEIALTNLFENAIKFTARQERARIQFGRTSTIAGSSFFISDNGVGFDMDYAAKLFVAFQRLHASAEFPGTGIGLATVQRVIHRCGGRIWARGQFGQGATFFFTLREQL
jgi:signal transduction histidine kinase